MLLSRVLRAGGQGTAHSSPHQMEMDRSNRWGGSLGGGGERRGRDGWVTSRLGAVGSAHQGGNTQTGLGEKEGPAGPGGGCGEQTCHILIWNQCPREGFRHSQSALYKQPPFLDSCQRESCRAPCPPPQRVGWPGWEGSQALSQGTPHGRCSLRPHCSLESGLCLESTELFWKSTVSPAYIRERRDTHLT